MHGSHPVPTARMVMTNSVRSARYASRAPTLDGKHRGAAMKRLAITGLIVSLMAGAYVGEAAAFSAETGRYSRSAAGLSDPDENLPVQPTPFGPAGTTYKSPGSGFSVHLSGPQNDQTSSELWFKPAGQDALGFQSKSHPRSIFPGQP